MTWPEARSALRAALAETGYTVHHVPPQAIDSPRPVIVMRPPARDVTERMAGIRRTVYTQTISVLGLASSEGEASLDEAGIAVDDVVEAINDVLDRHIALGGAAVVVSLPEWEELTVQDYPVGSGVPFAIMSCTLEITIDADRDFRA